LKLTVSSQFSARCKKVGCETRTGNWEHNEEVLKQWVRLQQIERLLRAVPSRKQRTSAGSLGNWVSKTRPTGGNVERNIDRNSIDHAKNRLSCENISGCLSSSS